MVGKWARTLVEEMKKRNVTLAVAESLTGGEVSARIVDVPGASLVLRGAVVSYATDLKHSLLGVDDGLLARGGPVQAEVAVQMAQGVTELCGSDYGLATTGVAGPGDTEDGPAGLVYVAFAGPGVPGGAKAVELQLPGNREEVRIGAFQGALALALKELGVMPEVNLGDNWPSY